MMKYINVTLDAYSILVAIILFTSIMFRHNLNDKVQGWFKIMVLNNALLALSDIFTLLFEGPAKPSNYIVLPISMFFFYIFSFSVIITTGIQIILFLNQEKYTKIVYITMITSTVIYSVFLIATPFTGFLYTFDENNIYSRGRFFSISIILQILMYLSLLVFMLLNVKTIARAKLPIILCFLFFPQITQVFQLRFYGLSLVPTGYSVSFLIMFMLANHRLEAYLDYTEIELDEKETELNQRVTEIQRSKLEVIKMQDHTIESLSNLVENRDEDTGEHVRRTRAYVELLAVQLMKNEKYPDIINPRYIRFLKRAAPMHDIGKIVVPDAILKKPGRLTEQEFEKIKMHASEGGRIVHEILDGYEDPQYIQMTADIATHHHEKWDGTGYPNQLKGEEIPLCARIMAIADVFDALVSPRIYKSPMSYEEAFMLIEEGRGIHFDPILVDEFLKIKEKNAAVNESFKVVESNNFFKEVRY